jgi:hypothetical protein
MERTRILPWEALWLFVVLVAAILIVLERVIGAYIDKKRVYLAV